MPYRFEIRADLDLLIFTPVGHVTEAELFAYLEEVRREPDYRVGLNRLVDISSLVDLDLSYAQMRNFQRNERFELPEGKTELRTAFVSSSGTGFGMARMYQSLAETRKQQIVGIFDTRVQALAFLGIAHAALDP